MSEHTIEIVVEDNKTQNGTDPDNTSSPVEENVDKPKEDIKVSSETSSNELKMKSKGDDNIVEILMEKQPEAIQGRRRNFLVYFYMPVTKPPEGEIMEYTPDRNSFVAKVFMIVFVMLAISSGFCMSAVFLDPVKDFCKSLPGIILLIIALSLIMIIGYCFCYDYARTFPLVAVLLVLSCFAYSILLIFIGARYAPFIIFGAASITALVVLLCYGLALTSIDFTKFLVVVIVISLAITLGLMFCFMITVVFGVKLTIVRLILLVASAVATSAMLIIQLQMILGGKTLELTTDEYFYAAYLLYTSIVTLFIQLVRILATIMDLVD